MTRLLIKNAEIENFENIKKSDFPKYTSFIMNQANRNAQSTRPKIVGQMSELVREFHKSSKGDNYEKWKDWYLEKNPKSIDNATNLLYEMVLKFKLAINLIDKKMVKAWVEDLIFSKTYTGFFFQDAILDKIAKLKKTTSRRSNPNEESKGIDGYIGEKPVSIKPITYKTQDMLIETIEVQIIYYEKKKNGIIIDFEF